MGMTSDCITQSNYTHSYKNSESQSSSQKNNVCVQQHSKQPHQQSCLNRLLFIQSIMNIHLIQWDQYGWIYFDSIPKINRRIYQICRQQNMRLKAVSEKMPEKCKMIEKINSMPVYADQAPSNTYSRKYSSISKTNNLYSVKPEIKSSFNISIKPHKFSKTLFPKTSTKSEYKYNLTKYEKIARNTHEHFHFQEGQAINRKPSEKIKFYAKSKIKQQQQKIANTLKNVLQKPKISSKPIGNIIGYAVNSHTGPFNEANQDRICIATALRKNNTKYDISLFGVFAGKNGIDKAEYFRDNFHKVLSNDQLLLTETEKALFRTFNSVQKGYSSLDPLNRSCSSVQFNLVLVFSALNSSKVSSFAYVYQLGKCRSFFSVEFGKAIIQPIKQMVNEAEKQKYTQITHVMKTNNQIPLIQKIKTIDQIDFMAIGSQGIFNQKGQRLIGRQVWKLLLSLDRGEKDKKNNTSDDSKIVQKLGISVNRLISSSLVSQALSNLSLIIIGFKQLKQCFQENEPFYLPYNTQITQTTEQNDF